LFEIDWRVAGRLERAIPPVARIDVVGGDGSRGGRGLARHGGSSVGRQTLPREDQEVLVRQEIVARGQPQASAPGGCDELVGGDAAIDRRGPRRLPIRPVDRGPPPPPLQTAPPPPDAPRGGGGGGGGGGPKPEDPPGPRRPP